MARQRKSLYLDADIIVFLQRESKRTSHSVTQVANDVLHRAMKGAGAEELTKMRPISLDSIDMALLGAIRAHPGQHMAEVLRGFTLVGESQAYARVRGFDAGGFVKLDRVSRRGRVFCHITEVGEKTLVEAQPCA